MLLAALVAALLLHTAVLTWLRNWLESPSPLEKLPPPFYTRVLYPRTAAKPAPAPPAAAKAGHARRKPRPAARIKAAPVIAAAESAVPDIDSKVNAPEPDASAPDAAPEPAASESVTSELPASEPAAAEPATSQAASAPEPQDDGGTTDPAAPSPAAAPPAFFDTWPRDTRLTYRLTGNYRGELHGSAKVLWQRLLDGQQARYQAEVRLNLGLLLSMRLTSQGQITEQGLAPQVYEEQIGQRRRHVRIGEDVQLNNGNRVPRPDDVQDTASQIVELAHRFATNQAQLAPGGSMHLRLARPNGVDQWVYDLLDEETLYLPRLGAVQALHLKPRRLGDDPGDRSISAEIWFAPSLQYLPVRILLTRGADTSVDLMVDTIEQQ